MPLEFSSGAIVFRREGGQILYLILHYEEGHWDFPKGKIEKGESVEETARREIAEETGITDVEFVPGFREKLKYFFRREGKTVAKTVYFQLAETKQKEVKLSFEHIGFEWLPFKKALEKLTFENAKRLLEKSNSFLKHGGVA
ncbi:MAG: bis(5'-nucleosyl)-tetraphosphatase [Candidatus Micrarchaeia archaeon]